MGLGEKAGTEVGERKGIMIKKKGETKEWGKKGREKTRQVKIVRLLTVREEENRNHWEDKIGCVTLKYIHSVRSRKKKKKGRGQVKGERKTGKPRE